MSVLIVQGDARQLPLKDKSVNCVVTSPPYFGLRDYGVVGQIGLEKTPQEYVDGLVTIFREVWRVLRDDGTVWLNLGDSYVGSWGNSGHRPELDKTASYQRAKTTEYFNRGGWDTRRERPPTSYRLPGLKPKDLIGIPWRVAFALQADGWYLRQDIIWHKPNPMPESVRDRCTKAHEYIFLLSKAARYYFDGDAIAEPCKETTLARLSQPSLNQQPGSNRVPGKTNGPMKACFGGRNKHAGYGTRIHSGREDNGNYLARGANKRSVWTITTKPFKGAHFATFPPDLAEPCILAGCPEGGTVLDPFAGSGTVGLVAKQHNRNAVLIELKPEYIEMAKRRVEAA